MRIKNNLDNGNVIANRPYEDFWRNEWYSPNSSDSINIINITNSSNHNSDNAEYMYSNLQARIEVIDNNRLSNTKKVVSVNKICNEQYKLNTKDNTSTLYNNSEETNLDGNTAISHSSILSPYNDNQDNDSSEEKSGSTILWHDNQNLTMPRGIINPNYPGFQHLAHTLQEYPINIDRKFDSDNDMSDDDENFSMESKSSLESSNFNNNNNNEACNENQHNDSNYSKVDTHDLDSHISDIPDLIKTVSKETYTNSTVNDANYLDTDIENNFHTKDIIGDFNKEIEDEIRLLLNYNINIENDLEELRKDIQDTFAKPIEDTINNISDVVNHVIKRLVETQSEDGEQTKNTEMNIEQDIDKAAKENEINRQAEMHSIRPSFLLLENKQNHGIQDAFLSDGKEEINVSEQEYNIDEVASSVEDTIKQLSTELRKIIPKLDEMRERDKLWTQAKPKITPTSLLTDDNCNDISIQNSSAHAQALKFSNIGPISSNKVSNSFFDINCSSKSHSESKALKARHKEVTAVKSSRIAQNNSSVRKRTKADEELDSFDVYNIETALPKLDIDAIENHIKAAKEAERRKRNDREEIRKRLAMGTEADEYYSMGHIERPGKKPSLHSRLQNGKNLQICFMNETASDNESQASDIERSYSSIYSSQSSLFSKSNHPYQTRPLSVNISKHDKMSTFQSVGKLRPSTGMKPQKSRSTLSLGHIEMKESNFYALQATLQTEARIALAQAKEMARIEMERSRMRRAASPVTEMLRRSMQKAGAPLAADRRRVSRQLLTDLNVAQLQVIVNQLHCEIESLNEWLVKLLMARDELHMSQDSQLVDIEDLTRYLGVKEQTKKTKGPAAVKSVRRLTSFVNKNFKPVSVRSTERSER